MGSRKRAGKGGHRNSAGSPGSHNNHDNHANHSFKSSRASREEEPADDDVSPASRGPLVLILLLLVMASSGAFVYLFNEDVNSVIVSLQSRFTDLQPSESAHVKIPMPGGDSNNFAQNSPELAKQTADQRRPADSQAETPIQQTRETTNQKQPSPQTANQKQPSSQTTNQKQPSPQTTNQKQQTDQPAQQSSNVESPSQTTADTREVKKEEPPVAPSKPVYSKADLTNDADNKIRGDIDDAEDWIERRRSTDALQLLSGILTRYPDSPRANFGKAQAMCLQAEVKQSNSLLEECIDQYLKVLDLPDVPKELYLKSGRACAERQQFRGYGYRATKVLKRLIERYPEEICLWNELGIQNLMVGRTNDARVAFQEMLRHDPTNAKAKGHMGFIYKTVDNEPHTAIPLLREALNSGQDDLKDGRFFFHLGDALQRVGNKSEAYEWYQRGSELGLFRSKWQRSLYNVDHLTGRPWWTSEQTGQTALIQALEKNWEMIRDEGLTNMDESGSFRPEEENLREKGDWKQFTLFQQGRKNTQNCQKAPKTCALIEKFADAANCKRGQVKYSIMQPGVHVWPHCGPTNCRIRAHLGLVVPDNCCQIRVVDDTRTWKEGKVIIFDDSFEHEVWHDGDSFRLVLIVDIWHPELTARHKAVLTPI